MLDFIRLIAAAALLLTGLFISVTATFGIFKFTSPLKRIHSAAMGDTLGILLCFLGLIVLSGFHFSTLKLCLILIFFWFASPVSSHLLTRLELTIDEDAKQECEVMKQ